MSDDFPEEGHYELLRPGETMERETQVFECTESRLGSKYRIQGVYRDKNPRPQPAPLGSVLFDGELTSNVCEITNLDKQWAERREHAMRPPDFLLDQNPKFIRANRTWSLVDDAGLLGEPQLEVGGHLLFVRQKSGLSAYWLDNGELSWRKSDLVPERTSVAVSAKFLVMESDRDLIGLEADTGSFLWKTKSPCGLIGLRMQGEIAIAECAAVDESSAGSIIALDPEKGTVLWTRPLDQGLKDIRSQSGSLFYLEGTQKSRGPKHAHLAAVDLRSGSLTFKVEIDDMVSSLLIVDKTAVVSGTRLTGYQVKDGRRLWRMNLDGGFGAAVLAADDPRDHFWVPTRRGFSQVLAITGRPIRTIPYPKAWIGPRHKATLASSAQGLLAWTSDPLTGILADVFLYKRGRWFVVVNIEKDARPRYVVDRYLVVEHGNEVAGYALEPMLRLCPVGKPGKDCMIQ